MRHALILSTALIAACAASGAAMAQSSASGAGGLRYLSWPGKPPVTQGAAPTLRRIPQPTTVAAPVDTPVSFIPLARLPAPAPAPASKPTPHRGLTPASDWIAPVPTTTPTMATTPQPYVAAPAPVEAAPPPVQAETVVAAQDPAPAQSPVPPQPHTQTQAQAQAAPEPAFDPMAPRRDAPIFRLQRQTTAQTAPETAAQAQGGTKAETASAAPPAMLQAALAPVQGARFYSVHRQAGRQPDRINTVQPIYLDALPVEMTQTPSSADLAQPDGPPALQRNSDGSVRAVPQTTGDDLP
ncbi:MAG: hypothetical protein KYX67_10950 [Brevundimonas sp.]|uniref:hypothetical protein n=1 Tax=Brevundimonas sp. TaxID=1871086 RepID=UPI00255D9A5C|nr:hypothetical protein [Brevundimonas sp.]MDK2747828.1 hypothetical protein [Brevundimonas sp.]